MCTIEFYLIDMFIGHIKYVFIMILSESACLTKILNTFVSDVNVFKKKKMLFS